MDADLIARSFAFLFFGAILGRMLLFLFRPLYDYLKRPRIKIRTEPDRPVGFGYKCAWLAIRSDSPARVLQHLPLKRVRAANWESGIAKAYEYPGRTVFVSPRTGKWVFVVGMPLLLMDEARRVKLLTELGTHFPDVQLFGTHRVSECHFWARAQNGKIVRQYAIEQGEVIIDEGGQTPEEKTLDLSAANETTVMQLADGWSLDPRYRFHEFNGVGVGHVGNI